MRYEQSMKTAVSLPDDLFENADLFAQQRDMTRSQLYAMALREYLQRHRNEDITARIDAAMQKIQTGTGEQPDERGLDALRRLPW